MIPIGDHSKTRIFPFVTYSLLTINIFVFFLMFTMNFSGLESFINQYALIPANIVGGEDAHTLLTSMFLHGGFGHIISNMLFLNIFGDNLEEKFGHFWYLIFYLTAGVAASALQIFVNPMTTIPNLGASGAIAGLLGGYLILFPRNKVDVLIPLGFVFSRSTVPAQLMLLYWIGFQLLQGVGTLGFGGGGVAYFAHIGGFVAGVGIAVVYKLFSR